MKCKCGRQDDLNEDYDVSCPYCGYIFSVSDSHLVNGKYLCANELCKTKEYLKIIEINNEKK